MNIFCWFQGYSFIDVLLFYKTKFMFFYTRHTVTKHNIIFVLFLFFFVFFFTKRTILEQKIISQISLFSFLKTKIRKYRNTLLRSMLLPNNFLFCSIFFYFVYENKIIRHTIIKQKFVFLCHVLK